MLPLQAVTRFLLPCTYEGGRLESDTIKMRIWTAENSVVGVACVRGSIDAKKKRHPLHPGGGLPSHTRVFCPIVLIVCFLVVAVDFDVAVRINRGGTFAMFSPKRFLTWFPLDGQSPCCSFGPSAVNFSRFGFSLAPSLLCSRRICMDLTSAL